MQAVFNQTAASSMYSIYGTLFSQESALRKGTLSNVLNAFPKALFALLGAFHLLAQVET